MWADWTVEGATKPEGPFVTPWLDYPIRVIGYDLLKLSEPLWSPRQIRLNAEKSWFMVGTTMLPDGMISLGPGESHSRLIWPAGMGQLWPAAKDVRPVAQVPGQPAYSGDLLDLHGQCYGGGSVTLILTVFYTRQIK
jgi:hypothetical protein